jgi:hypothetical protein
MGRLARPLLGQRISAALAPTNAVLGTFMRISQIVTALAFAVACTSAATPSVAAPSDVSVYPSAQDEAMTEGETVLAADPDVAYRAVTDYPRWAVMFPDIRRVVITGSADGHDRVTFIHADGNRDNIHFHNQPAARTVWFEDTGGRAEVWVEIVFRPGDRPGTSRVHSRLYADVHGWASIFVSDGKLRNMREQRVRQDLGQLRQYFARDVAAQVPPEPSVTTTGTR